MPKSSRPDIQVLEARVARLKSQLLEYKDVQIYEMTRNRLAVVAAELMECYEILAEVTGADGDHPIDRKTVSEVRDEGPANIDPVEAEFDDGDLGDIDFPIVPKTPSEKTPNEYAPKFIMRTYCSRLQECADTPTGIIQVNQVCYMLNSWFQARFVQPSASSVHYKANRIHEWIDLIIMVAGREIHDGTFLDFSSRMNDWIDSLSTSKDMGWLMPLEVRQVEQHDTAYTKEAVLIEKVIKTMLYNSDFYPKEIDSIRRIVIEKKGYTEEELEVTRLLSECTHLISTSSFDAEKYR